MRLCLPALGLAASAFATSPEAFLPPAPAWHGASETLIAKPDHPWITPAEKLQLLDTPNYDDTIAWLERLADASPLIDLQPFGRTAQGRTLWLVIASKEKTFTPEALRARGKPALFVQAGIHSGEIDGKDAGLMLLRDLAFGGKSDLLDRANFLFVPVLNADGHERSSTSNRPNQRGPVHQGWRTTAQNLNLNRDYMKADAPEMRALLGLLATWQPSLYVDVHVTDGMDYQYDITYVYNGADGAATWSPHIAAWFDQRLQPAADRALKAQGHIPLARYVDAVNPRDFTQGLGTGHAPARFSQGYGDLRHLPTVLVETHSLKSYRQRVLGTYVLLESMLEIVGREGGTLRSAITADQAARPPSVPLNWAESAEKHEMDFLGIEFETYPSPASGTTEVRWMGRPKLFPQVPVFTNQPVLHRPRPLAYWVPVTKPEVIDRLRLHGVQMETLSAARTLPIELYRLVNPKSAAEPFEGRHPLTAGVKAETHTETFPAGSVRVSTDQPLGGVVMALLEPEGTDSLLAWGFFAEILQRTEYIEGYIVAPLAEQMLAADPKLKAEFDAKLAADEKFAQDPPARLQWFYARSPFYDSRYLLYPVGIERRTE